MPKKWIVRSIDPGQQKDLAQALSISPITASVLLGRGLTTPELARRWLSPNGTVSHDPFLIPDMEKAVDRIHRGVAAREQLCFYGDYDVDGMAATSVYVKFFQSLGAHVGIYIPHRIQEGYGLNEPAVRRLRQRGVGLLVTSDCGTLAHHEVGVAQSLGMDVVVTDHHQVDGQLPPAFAVLNPHREGALYPFRDLCSGALAYKVAQAYQLKYGGADLRAESMLDLVSLATVADVVPLEDENRLFVREGLTLISEGLRCGIRALKQRVGVDRACTTGTVAFKLAPRINAAGRLAHGEVGVSLLTTELDSEAAALANHLEDLNTERQRLESDMRSEAVGMVESDSPPPAIVLGARRWHLGVVGIVAARLVEHFDRPAVVLAISEEGIGKGSARSVPGFDLHAALATCRDLLIGFGGHPSAAGLTIRESHIPAFRERFGQLASEWAAEKAGTHGLHVDTEVNLTKVDHKLMTELDRLQPFGAGNPEPTFAARNLSVLEVKVVGDCHLKLTVRHKNSVPFHGIGFRMGSLAALGLSHTRPLDLAFVPELNRWNGMDRIQLRILDLQST